MESTASYQELVPMNQSPPKKPFRRPVSYSDSFFFIPTSLDPLDLSGSSLEQPIQPSQPSEVHQPSQPSEVHQPSQPSEVHQPSQSTQPTHESPWSSRALTSLSFLFHISLISIFESAFFYLFISKSEDKGITNTVSHLIGTITSTCPWPTNQTAIVSDILRIFIDPTQVAITASVAAETRRSYNAQIFLQAWMYSTGIVVGTGVLFLVAAYKGILTRSKLRGILLENLGLVAMLGVYEFIFFKTIIYKYDSVSVPEIEGNIVEALQTQCGLLSDP